MILSYPVALQPDNNDAFMVTAPDFPELATYGEDREEALARAVDALEAAIAARMYSRKDIPPPSPGDECAVLSAIITAKVMLYQGMREQGVGKVELARRLNWRLARVDRVVDINYRSRLDDMDAALRVVGRRVAVEPLNV